MNSTVDPLNARVQRVVKPSLFALLAVGLLLAGAGCNKEAKVAGDSGVTGTFALVSVDGKPVPCVVQHGGQSPTVKSGQMVFKADGTGVGTTVFSIGSAPDNSRQVETTYTRQGAKLTLQWKGAGTTTGTLDGSTFTMDNEGMIFVYRK